jgi:hypothetical protein
MKLNLNSYPSSSSPSSSSSSSSYAGHHEIRFKITDQEAKLFQDTANYFYYEKHILEKPNIQELARWCIKNAVNASQDLVTQAKGRHVFLKTGKSMLLIFNPENTRVKGNSKFPVHGAIITPPACIHLAFEIEKQDYEDSKNMLEQNNVRIEKEMGWDKEGSKSIYFRDPADNLIEFITKGNWPVED